MKKTNLFLTCLALLLLSACNMPLQSTTLIPTVNPAESSAPLSTIFPTGLPSNLPTSVASMPGLTSTTLPTDIPQNLPTPIPLFRLVSLTTSTSEESGKAPDYTLKTEIPVLQGVDDPRVKKFNEEVLQIIQTGIDQFRQELAAQPATPIAGGSFYSVKYELVSPTGSNFLSLQIIVEGMSDGAAHPYHVTLSYNYDLEKGEQITVNQLFLHGVNPLQTISDFCKAELDKRDIGFDGFGGGAEPTPENYAVWNLSSQGLVIVFNEYQVASYAAGPQTIIIPFEALGNIIKPGSALAEMKQ